jgi:hypothetical protein
MCDILFSCFFVPRIKKSAARIISITIFNILFVILVLSSSENIYLKEFSAALLYSVVFYFLYNTGYIKVFIASIAYVAITLCVETPLYIYLPIIIGSEKLETISNNYFALTIIGFLVKFCILTVVIMVCRLFGRKGYLKLLVTRDWLTFLCMPLLSICILISLIYSDANSISVLISIVLLFVNVFFYSYLQENGLQNKRKQELLALEEHNKQQIKAFEDICSIYEEQRKQIHEFKNQINFIYGLIRKEDIKTLDNYVSEIKTDIDSEYQYIETGNSVINILINQSIKKALAKHIAILPDIKINSKILIDDHDLVIILSNLLNNAIEHCETLVNSNKIISFILESTPNHIFILCANPIESTIIVENNLVMTTKSNIYEHGCGLKNILQTVSKYNGDVSISTDDNKFKYLIIINYGES